MGLLYEGAAVDFWSGVVAEAGRRWALTSQIVGSQCRLRGDRYGYVMRLRSLAVLSVLVVACDYGGSSGSSVTPPPSGGPSASPTDTPTASTGGVGAIEHATGATDVVIRFEEGGGFVAPAFLATRAPIFTLYGDGTVIFRKPRLDRLPAIGSVAPLRPFRVARLSEDQVQTVLQDALGPGRLGAARYPSSRSNPSGSAHIAADSRG